MSSAMSASGHKRTFAVHHPMSALHPIAATKADMAASFDYFVGCSEKLIWN
jgi:hypothetical protein